METEKGKQASETKSQIVLVVEGRPTRQFYSSIFLQRLKYHVVTARTAEDALTFIEMTVSLAIVTNINLPQMGGLDLLKRVKKDPRTRAVPVIIYSAGNDTQIQQVCERAGCAVFLSHPSSLEEVYLAIQQATEKKPRRFVRLETYLNVIIGDGSPFYSLERKDFIVVISELGMFVATTGQLAYGSIHPFTFYLPNAPGQIIRVEGKIVYNHTSSDVTKQQGVGVKFTKIGDQEREFIKDFIRGKLVEGIIEK